MNSPKKYERCKTGSTGDGDGDSDSEGDDGEHKEQLMIRWSARKPHRGGALSAHGAEKRGRKWVPRLSVPRTLTVRGCCARAFEKEAQEHNKHLYGEIETQEDQKH